MLAEHSSIGEADKELIVKLVTGQGRGSHFGAKQQQGGVEGEVEVGASSEVAGEDAMIGGGDGGGDY